MALAVLLAGMALTGEHNAALAKVRQATPRPQAASEDCRPAAAGLTAGADSVLDSGQPRAAWGPALLDRQAQPGRLAFTASAVKPAQSVNSPRPNPAARASRERKLLMRVTAYCPCSKCCDGYAMIPMSRRLIGGGSVPLYPLIRDKVGFAAAPASLPFGTRLIIPGYNGGRAVKVLDRGGDIQGNRLDLFMPTHQQALAWGSRVLSVIICP